MEDQVLTQPELVADQVVTQEERPSFQLQDCPKDICPPITMSNNDGHQITFKYCQLLETLRIAEQNFTTCKDEIVAEVEDALQFMGIESKQE